MDKYNLTEMKKSSRKTLAELCDICNQLGSDLDGTATNPQKYIDRQNAHKYVFRVLYGVLCDSPDNDQLKHDLEQVDKAMAELRALTEKVYPDRRGFTSFTD